MAPARKGGPPNGRERLEEAMALLIQNQAEFLGRLAESEHRHSENEQRRLEIERRLLETERLNAKRFARIDKRFARLEADLATVIQVLAEHSRMLERLPEAIREKIGFKPQP
jgi:hypothetical protein